MRLAAAERNAQERGFPEGDAAIAGMTATAAFYRPVRIWLWIMVGLVFSMTLLGGATRLTQSGLSIVEWRPITGVLPPLDASQWLIEFEKYKKIPQYYKMNAGMSLSDFKYIYYWEWGHRLLGRFIGLAFAIPFLAFWIAGRLNPILTLKLLGVLALGGLQGAVGWWMVSSGLVNRVDVAQERLAIHLLLASITILAMTRIAVSLRPKPVEALGIYGGGLKILATVLLIAILLQIGIGGLVAGLKAGLIYNTWPLMDGRFAPSFEHLFAIKPLALNFFDNMSMVQLEHRMMAYAVGLLAIINLCLAMASAPRSSASRRSIAIAVLIIAQIALGVATLLLAVPIWLALAHQGLAIICLIMASAHDARMSETPFA